MQVKHELVIRRAIGDWQADLAGHMRQLASQAAVRWANFPGLHQLRQKVMERLAHVPHAPNGRIDVGKDPQNARAVRGPGRKCVYVEQVISLVQ